MAQCFPDDRGAGRVDASRRDLAFLPDDGIAADGTAAPHYERRRVFGPFLEDHADDLWDHVAALLDDDGVSDADVLPREVLVVVKRRAFDGGSGQHHGFQVRDWSEHP